MHKNSHESGDLRAGLQMLDCLQGLVPQPVNARVLHRMLDGAYMANADIMVPMVASFVVQTTIHFEMNAGIYPHARIWTDKLEGYLLYSGNVSRVMLLRESTLDMSWVKACGCKAGHLFWYDCDFTPLSVHLQLIFTCMGRICEYNGYMSVSARRTKKYTCVPTPVPCDARR
jgi:hypothetical protein